jgi:hypothetical protein
MLRLLTFRLNCRHKQRGNLSKQNAVCKRPAFFRLLKMVSQPRERTLRQLIIILLAGVSFSLRRQCITTFQDVNNFVYVFDGGQSKYIESLPLTSYKIGRANIMAYITNSGRLKVYWKGKVFPVIDNTPTAYYMTDNWFLYNNYNVIKLLYNNEFKTLEMVYDPSTNKIWCSDSVVVWNNQLGELNAFYGGQTQLLERTDITSPKIGPNIFAYMDISGNFKVFYNGQLQTLEAYQPPVFEVNQDMLMYFDQYSNIKYFHDGVLEETSIPAPSEYRLGKDFVAYMSTLRQLVVYYKGEQTILDEDHPAKWAVRKNIMVWTDKGNNFWCWYNGKKYWLERYTPMSYKLDNDIVVYQDLDGRLKGFYYGEQVEISDQIVSSYTLFNEAVTYSLNPYETTVWCNKKTYLFK